jgi:hypothetical protein
MRLTLILTLLLLILPVASHGQSADDREGVRQAVLDYVEALYEANPARIERSVHPDLVKRGFYTEKDKTGYQTGIMTYQQLFDLAGRWNKKGWLPKDAPKEIVVFDVLDQTATAKLTAYWGVDYFQLAKYDGKWKIIHVLWQSPPPKTKP